MRQPKREIEILSLLLLAFILSVAVPLKAAGNGAGDSDVATATHFGYPRDWSSSHIVMTGNDDSAALKAGLAEPRHVYNLVRRRAAIEAARRGRRPRKNAIKVDWAVSFQIGSFPLINFRHNTVLTSLRKVAIVIMWCSVSP